jgi:dolichol kinase
MVLIAWLNAAIIWIYGLKMLIHIVNRWEDPVKQASKYSELVYVFAFSIIGYYIIILFDKEPMAPRYQLIYHGIMLFAFLAINVWLHLIQIRRERKRLAKHPELIDTDPEFTRNYAEFIKMLDEKYLFGKSDDIIKDLSRKALHFVLLAVVIGVYELGLFLERDLATIGLTPIAFRNLLYIIAAMFFVMMFTTSDLLRITNFEFEPLWARKWYFKSLEHRTESWTVISSVPFLLTLLLFLFAPLQVLFCAAAVSCIADSVASVVGKNYGKRKMTNFGRFPNKSFEGLLAGTLSAFISVMAVFLFYPVAGLESLHIYAISLLCAFSFIYIDAFSTKLADNILNSLIPGIIVWASLYIFL